MEWTSDRAGNITLQVLSTTKSLGSYTITSEFIVDDHGNDSGHATELTLEAPTKGSLQFVQDGDWFRFHAEAGQSYVLNWSSGSEAASSISLYRGKSATPVGTASLLDDGPGKFLFKADTCECRPQ